MEKEGEGEERIHFSPRRKISIPERFSIEKVLWLADSRISVNFKHDAS